MPRYFVTGASGFIGQAVIQELISHGHSVLGLARSDASASIIAKLGGQVQRGSLEDHESLKSGAQATDGVIHLAFIHDFANFDHSVVVDQAAIKALGEALAGTGKPLSIASGTAIVTGGPGEMASAAATENDRPDVSDSSVTARARSADLVYALSKDNNVRGSVVRLPPTVHGEGDKAFVPVLINLARKNGYVGHVSDGSNRWPAVHRLDAAAVFRLAVEKGSPGATYHAVADEGVPMKEIAGLIGKKLNLPVKTLTVAELGSALGMIGYIAAKDNPTSSEKTRKELGWKPEQPGLLEDMEAHYF
ncbi:hypothetical protein ABEF93_000799 [Exophiala dermatitidis]